MTDQPAKPPAVTPPLDALLDAASGLAVVGYNREGRITYFNRGAERLFGYRAGMLAGAATFEVLHDREEFDRALRAVSIEEVSGREVPLDVLTRTRDVVPVDATFVHVPEDAAGTELLVLYRDRSPLLRAMESPRPLPGQFTFHGASQSDKEAEFLSEMLRHTVETVQIALSVHDSQSGMIVHTNEAFQELTGVYHPLIIGMTLSQILEAHPETKERVCGYVEELRTAAVEEGKPPTAQHWELEFPSGKRVVEVYGRLIGLEGYDRQFVLLIIEDNTERQRLQMQLVQSEKLAAVGQLAAGIAHEIRNPLNTIFNALFDLDELLENRSAEAEEDITIAMEEIKRVQDIINNLLDFARESERTQGKSDVNDVLRKTIRLVQHDLTRRSIEVEWNLETLPEAAISNNALKQILINLLTNAAHAMANGGTLTLRTSRRDGLVPSRSNHPVLVKASGGTARLRFAPGADKEGEESVRCYREHVVLEIADSGPGIPPDVMSNIFNPFFTTKEPGSGTGLGLSVVHSLVEDSAGAVSVSSRLGRGTKFTLEIPCLPAGEED